MVDIPSKISFCIGLSFINNNFIFSVSIIIITIQLCVFFNPQMPSEYYCPRCQSRNVIVYDDHIECTGCKLNFSIEDIEKGIDDENILAEEELHGFADAFDE
ncbi:MAG: hypothetical protein HWN81_02950, partial [Candidatus Lokiarchaeota archaeon]|nr:hypothetical protein [Candidatus Lokiarchaeota archaeon]